MLKDWYTCISTDWSVGILEKEDIGAQICYQNLVLKSRIPSW